MVPKRAKHFKCNKSNLHTHLPYFYSMAFCDIASKLVGIKCQIFYIPMRVCLVFLLIEFEEVQAVLVQSNNVLMTSFAVYIVNFEQILLNALMFPLFTLSNILVLLSRTIIYKLLCATAKIQLCKCRFKEGVDLI